MFSGIGGFELGIQRATKGEWECIGFSEIDKHAIQVYQKHFPKHKNYGSATEIDTNKLPNFDFLCGGFPCQAFSIAGKQGGFQDTRGTLFFEIARILKAKRPKAFLLENVKGLLNHDKGKTFSTILNTLVALGYDVQTVLLNSKFFGVPQNRERVFIIGHIRDRSRRKILSFPSSSKKINKQQSASQHKIARGMPMIKAVLTPEREKKRQNGRRFKEDGEEMFTLTGQDKHGVMIDSDIRKLTPLECERLQGFPDNWTKELSDTQRYKTCGNAVTVCVIEEIMSGLINKECKDEPKRL